jgi:hypothetical protein
LDNNDGGGGGDGKRTNKRQLRKKNPNEYGESTAEYRKGLNEGNFYLSIRLRNRAA